MAWARTSIHVQEYGTRHHHDIHLTPYYFLESMLEQSLQPRHFSNFSHRAAGEVGVLPIVGFLNCGPTCKANSNARPQTHLYFAWTPTIILTRKARPKKTRTTRIHFTTPVSWISAFSMHSLLICGGSILRASFFFECKEVDVASSHLVSCLASILVLPPVRFSLRLSSNMHTK